MSDGGGEVERGGCVEIVDEGGEVEEEEEEVMYLVSVVMCECVILVSV